MKKIYETPSMEVIYFEEDDIVRTSGFSDPSADDDDWGAPPANW